VPRIESISLRIKTGPKGSDAPVRIRFNGFELPLETVSGDVGPYGAYEGRFALRSVGHGCALIGPKAAPWDVASLQATFDYGAVAPAETWDFGGRTLAPGEEWNLLEKPPVAFDV
jgi:hypothetical protein